jgi:hypothetical protein
VNSREGNKDAVVVVQCVHGSVSKEDKGDWAALVNAQWVDMVSQPLCLPLASSCRAITYSSRCVVVIWLAKSLGAG